MWMKKRKVGWYHWAASTNHLLLLLFWPHWGLFGILVSPAMQPQGPKHWTTREAPVSLAHNLPPLSFHYTRKKIFFPERQSHYYLVFYFLQPNPIYLGLFRGCFYSHTSSPLLRKWNFWHPMEMYQFSNPSYAALKSWAKDILNLDTKTQIICKDQNSLVFLGCPIIIHQHQLQRKCSTIQLLRKSKIPLTDSFELVR